MSRSCFLSTIQGNLCNKRPSSKSWSVLICSKNSFPAAFLRIIRSHLFRQPSVFLMLNNHLQVSYLLLSLQAGAFQLLLSCLVGKSPYHQKRYLKDYTCFWYDSRKPGGGKKKNLLLKSLSLGLFQANRIGILDWFFSCTFPILSLLQQVHSSIIKDLCFCEMFFYVLKCPRRLQSTSTRTALTPGHSSRPCRPLPFFWAGAPWGWCCSCGPNYAFSSPLLGASWAQRNFQ